MDRIKQAVAADISVGFEAGGPGPDEATVEILRSDGTVLVAERAATGGGVGEFSTHLTPAETAELDTLTAVWHAMLDGEETTIRTEVEIAGDFYFTIAEFEVQYPDVDRPAERIVRERKSAEDTIEGALKFACVPRAKRFRLSGDGRLRTLLIPVHHLRRLISGTVGVDPLDVATVGVDALGLWRDVSWPAGHGNVSLLVEHGLDSPSEWIKGAAMLLAYHRLTSGPLDDRKISQVVEGGVVNYAQPGMRGSVTGIPEVDAAIKQEALSDPRSRLAIV